MDAPRSLDRAEDRLPSPSRLRAGGILCLLLGVMAVTFLGRASNARWYRGYDYIDPDSATFVRLARLLSRPGPLPERDPDTWVPLGRDFRGFSLIFPRLLAASGHALQRVRPSMSPTLSLEATAFYYPAVCSALAAAALFWALVPLLGCPAALLAALAWGVMPVVASRTMVGYADRDALCLLLTFVVLGAYLRAWDAARPFRRIAWSVVSGITAVVYQAVWAGAGLVTVIVVIAELCFCLRGRSDAAQRQRFLPWCLLILVPGGAGWVAPYRWLPTSFLNVAPAGLTAILLLVSAAADRWRRQAGGWIAGGQAGGWIADGPVGGRFAARPAAARAAVALMSCIAGAGAFMAAGGRSWGVKLAEILALPMGASRLLMTVAELRLPRPWMWAEAFGWVAAPAGLGLLYLIHVRHGAETARHAAETARHGAETARHGAETARHRLGRLAGWGLFLLFSVSFPSFVLAPSLRWIEPFYLPLGVLLLALTIPRRRAWSGMLQLPVKGEALFSSSARASTAGDGALLLLAWFVAGLWASRGGVRFWMFLAPCVLALAAFGADRLLAGIAPRRSEPLMLAATAAPVLALLCGMAGLTAACLSVCAALLAVCAAPEAIDEPRVGGQADDVRHPGDEPGGACPPGDEPGGACPPGDESGGACPSGDESVGAGFPWIPAAFGSLVVGVICCALLSWTQQTAAETRARADHWYHAVAPMLADLRKVLPPGATTLAFWDKSSTLGLYLNQRTVIDSEHFIPYWIYRASRDVVGTRDPRAALRFLRAHGADYLLMTAMDLDAYNMDQWMSADRPGPPSQRISRLRPVTIRREGRSIIIYGRADPDLEAMWAEQYPGKTRLVRVEMALQSVSHAGKRSALRKEWTDWQPKGAWVRLFYADHAETYSLDGGSVAGATVGPVLPATRPGWLVAAPDGSTPGSGWSLYYLRPGERDSLTARLFLFRESVPGFEPILQRPGYALWRIHAPASLRAEPDDLRADFPPDRSASWKTW